MEKKVGKFISILIFLSVNLWASNSSIVLRMQDMNHESIDQAMIKAPFMLHVELKNIETFYDINHIQGFENFKYSRSMNSQNVSIENGVKTVINVYSFVLRTDKKGKYDVGPLKIKNKKGRVITSNKLMIKVGDEVVSTDGNQTEKYALNVKLNKKKVYLGEKLELSIQFIDRVFVEGLQLYMDPLDEFLIPKQQKRPTNGMKKIKDNDYSVTQWLYDIYPKKIGNLVIDGIQTNFYDARPEKKFKTGGSFNFFSPIQKFEYALRAKPVALEVMPLPKKDGFENVTAVGEFEKIIIKLNKESVKAGQGVTLTVEIFGDGNFDIMKALDLNLPDGFKYYDSESITIDERRIYQKSEFIIQMDTPGTYDIESQKIFYFDPVKEVYEILQSNSLNLIVTPHLEADETDREKDLLQDDSSTIDEDQEAKLDNCLILNNKSLHFVKPIVISLSFYSYLLWALYLLWILFAIYRYFIKTHLFESSSFKKIIIFYRAKKDYKLAAKKEDPVLLYSSFANLFSKLQKINIDLVHNETIVEYLTLQNFSNNQIEDWKKFYSEMSKAAFLKNNKINRQSLFKKSLKWLKLLKEKS